MLILSQYYALEKCSDFILGKIVWKFTHFVKQIDILVQHYGQIWLQNSVYEKIDVRFFENMGNLLKKFIEWNSALVVAFLGYLV